MSNPRPVGGRLVSAAILFFAPLAVLCVLLILKRLVFGIGSVTALNGGYPWGLWIAFDLLVGTGFACGGWALAWTVYIFNKGKYHALVRPALLASLFGYSLGGLSITIDMGRYWHLPYFYIPGQFNTNSVLFETAFCMTVYIIVVTLEFAPVWLGFLGGMDDHIAAALAGDKPGGFTDGGLKQLWKASHRGLHLVDRGLHLGNGGDHTGLALTEGNTLVPLGKGVVYGFDDHSRHADTQKRVPDGDGITEVDPLQERRILRLFPERFKGHLHRGDGRSQRIGFDVAVGFRSEGILGYNSVKLVGEIHDERFRPDDLRGHNRKRDLRQRDHGFGIRALWGVHRIRKQSRVHAAVVLILLQCGEVLAVFNDHAGLLPAVRMELYREVVPFKLAVPFGEHGAFRAAKAGSDAFRLGDGKCLCIRVVRPAREACISRQKLRENELWGAAIGTERQHRHIGKVIRNVLTVDRDDAV